MMVIKDICKICLEPVEGLGGVMDLNENDLCDDCCAREERAAVVFKERRESMDFDFSLNH